MATFDFISVALSFVIGLSIAHMLVSAVSVFRLRRHLSLDWMPLAWALSIFLFQFQFWWAIYELAGLVRQWTFYGFAGLVALALCLFAAGALVLPAVERDGERNQLAEFDSLLAGMITVAAGWRAGPSGLLRGFMLMAIALTLLHPGSLTAAQPNQPAKAPAQLQSACDKGDGQACYDLGTRYEKGDGVAQNADRAVTLYERSCEIGYAGNCWYLGTIYEDGGFGLVAPNVNRAAALYRKGCDRGDGNACFSLGLLYKAGKGVPRNPAAAAAFIRKGCVDLASGVCEDSGGLAVHMTGLGATARTQASAPSSPTAPAPASKSASPPQQASPSPSNQSLFSIFGVRLGADRFDAVKTMLDRNRADFFDYFDGTAALNDATRKVVSRRLVVSDARFAGISARGTRVLFDFASEADPILSTVTVLYGPGVAGLQAERVAALTRQFGVDDGKGNAAQWHRVVPGAEIALFADSQTGAVIERYVYSKEQRGAR